MTVGQRDLLIRIGQMWLAEFVLLDLEIFFNHGLQQDTTRNPFEIALFVVVKDGNFATKLRIKLIGRFDHFPNSEFPRRQIFFEYNSQLNKLEVTKVAHFEGHRDSVYSLAIDRETGSIYSAGADGYVIRWNWPIDSNGELIAQLPQAIYSIYIYEGKIYCGTSTGEVYCLSESDREVAAQSTLHSLGTFAFTGQEQHIYSGGGNGELVKSDLLLNEDSRRKLLPDKTSIRNLHSRGDSLFAACSDNKIHILEPATLNSIDVIEGHANSVFDLAFAEEYMFSTGRDATIRKTNLADPREFATVNAHLYTIQTLAISPDETLLLSGSLDKSIRIWSTELDLLKVVNKEKQDAHTNAVNKVLWIDSNHFISCGDDRAIMLFHVGSD